MSGLLSEEERKGRRRERNRLYRLSEKGRATERRYSQSKKGRESHRKARSRYSESTKGKCYFKSGLYRAAVRRYKQSVKGRAAKRRADGKFKNKKTRNLGFVKLFPNPFVPTRPICWHHVDDEHVVALPEELHQRYGGFGREKHRELLAPYVEIYYGAV